MAGDYTEYYEVLASLGVSQRVITTNSFYVSDPLGCYYEWDNTYQCVNNAGSGTHTYTYNSDNKITSSSKDGTQVYELGYNSDSRVSSYNDLSGEYESNTADATYTDEGLLQRITSNSSYTGSYSSSTEKVVIDYTYSSGNLTKLVKTEITTSTYSEETSTYQYRYEYIYTWKNGEVVEMIGKVYTISGSEETLYKSFKREFVSDTGGVLTWQETQYNTSDESIQYQWSLVYTDEDQDGNIDTFVRTLTNDVTSYNTEYTISFSYNENGKVETVTYTNNTYSSYTATETLSYR
jgi:YD repeat-containing protein